MSRGCAAFSTIVSMDSEANPWLEPLKVDPVRERRERASIFRDQRAFSDSKRILVAVFGGNSAGTSTFLRQAALFNTGNDENERTAVGREIQDTVLNTMRLIMAEIPIYDDSTIQSAISSFAQADEKDQSLISSTLQDLWANSVIEEIIRASPRFQKHSAFLEYFLDSISRISAPGYIPTDLDILLCKPTSPVTETQFMVTSNIHRKATNLVRVRRDVGLQRKWIHLLSDSMALIFVVDLACYDQTVYSVDTDQPRNAMRETMHHFESVCLAPLMNFWRAVLIMNKFDVFTEKLRQVPFTECFPEYTGPNEPRAVAAYCIERFASIASQRVSHGGLEIRGWCTNALDVDQMSVTFGEISEYLYQMFIPRWII
ncbi:guanine nucleotide binding protein, alpha subunit [Mycena capillaripes]|nr:guanine nucleotide binding protein, alpha subunit [Mycena capillaripes]